MEKILFYHLKKNVGIRSIKIQCSVIDRAAHLGPPRLVLLQITYLGDKSYIDEFEGGKYSTTGFVLQFKRLRTPFMIQTFMPSTLFVFTSWISFVMPPGIRFINILCPQLLYEILAPKISTQNTAFVQNFGNKKRERKMLMKLTAGIKFTYLM